MPAFSAACITVLPSSTSTFWPSSSISTIVLCRRLRSGVRSGDFAVADLGRRGMRLVLLGLFDHRDELTCEVLGIAHRHRRGVAQRARLCGPGCCRRQNWGTASRGGVAAPPSARWWHRAGRRKATGSAICFVSTGRLKPTPLRASRAEQSDRHQRAMLGRAPAGQRASRSSALRRHGTPARQNRSAAHTPNSSPWARPLAPSTPPNMRKRSGRGGLEARQPLIGIASPQPPSRSTYTWTWGWSIASSRSRTGRWSQPPPNEGPR